MAKSLAFENFREMLLLERELRDIVNGDQVKPAVTETTELKKWLIEDGTARACIIHHPSDHIVIVAS